MDPEFKKELITECKKALGISGCHTPYKSESHLRALKTARGASLLYRSKLVLKTMGYSEQEFETAARKLLET